MRQHVVDLEPAPRGAATMIYEGRIVGTSHQPIHAAARWLLAQGLAGPEDELETRRGDMPCLRGVVGNLAALTVTERDKDGLRVEPFKPFATSRGEPADGRETASGISDYPDAQKAS